MEVQTANRSKHNESASPLTLERYAKVLAVVAHYPSDPVGELYARLGVDEAAFAEAKERWSKALEQDAKGNPPTLTLQFSQHFVSEKQRLDRDKPPVSALGPLTPSSSAQQRPADSNASTAGDATGSSPAGPPAIVKPAAPPADPARAPVLGPGASVGEQLAGVRQQRANAPQVPAPQVPAAPVPAPPVPARHVPVMHVPVRSAASVRSGADLVRQALQAKGPPPVHARSPEETAALPEGFLAEPATPFVEGAPVRVPVSSAPPRAIDPAGETVTGVGIAVTDPLPFSSSASSDGPSPMSVSAQIAAGLRGTVALEDDGTGQPQPPALPFPSPTDGTDAATEKLRPDWSGPPSANGLPSRRPTLTVDHYASLCAERTVAPARRDEIHRRYGLATAAMVETVEREWQVRLAADDALRAEWKAKRDGYVRWLRSGGGQQR